MRRKPVLHPEAWDDYFQASAWYHSQDPSASLRFEAAVDGALEEIGQRPLAWPLIDRRTRQRVLTDFPFSILYRVETDTVNVLAIAHAKRRPGYWRKRRW
jgi:plasmid stabilization system protein ParE